jgi:hypothetical protein
LRADRGANARAAAQAHKRNIHMTKNTMSAQNAVKTGAYARDHLLPWESPAEHEKHRAEIFADLRPEGPIQRGIVENIVENRWLRRRLQRTTAISAHRHPFGRALEESGAKSWQDAVSYLQKRDVEFKKELQNNAARFNEVAEAAEEWELDGKLESLPQKLLDVCSKASEHLTHIATALDEEREFFAEYSPKQLEDRIRIENSLDAQYDKLRARLVVEQEARALREKLRKGQDTIGTTVPSHDNIEEGGVSNSANEGAPASERAVRDFFDELGRDDDDTDEWGEPKATG